MYKKITRIKDLLLDIIINGMVFYGIFLGVVFMFNTLIPTSWLFNYKSVEPIAKTMPVGTGEMVLVSQLDIYSKGDFYWNDVLRCLGADGNYSYYSQQNTNSEAVPVALNKVSIWAYRGQLPHTAATCRMYSSITRTLPMGVEKQQDIISGEFNFFE